MQNLPHYSFLLRFTSSQSFVRMSLRRTSRRQNNFRPNFLVFRSEQMLSRIICFRHRSRSWTSTFLSDWSNKFLSFGHIPALPTNFLIPGSLFWSCIGTFCGLYWLALTDKGLSWLTVAIRVSLQALVTANWFASKPEDLFSCYVWFLRVQRKF